MKHLLSLVFFVLLGANASSQTLSELQQTATSYGTQLFTDTTYTQPFVCTYPTLLSVMRIVKGSDNADSFKLQRYVRVDDSTYTWMTSRAYNEQTGSYDTLLLLSTNPNYMIIPMAGIPSYFRLARLDTSATSKIGWRIVR